LASVYQLKSKFQIVLRPLANLLARWGVTANQVTLLACFLSIVVGLCFLFGHLEPIYFLILPVFLLMRMGLNAIDGMLAREHNMQSKVGAILNELTDVISDSFLYYPLGLIWGVHIHLVVGFVLLAVLVEMVGVVSVQVGSSRRYDGPMGKSDRALAFSILAILYAAGVSLHPYLSWVFIVFILLEIVTTLNRAQNALKEKKN